VSNFSTPLSVIFAAGKFQFWYLIFFVLCHCVILFIGQTHLVLAQYVQYLLLLARGRHNRSAGAAKLHF
jgi:hypothetical protein